MKYFASAIFLLIGAFAVGQDEDIQAKVKAFQKESAGQMKLTAVSEDPSFGSKENPIRVGGEGPGPERSRSYLNALLGPQGQAIDYHRLGSCCHFETDNSNLGGMLDHYEITYPGLKEPISLYINFYDPGPKVAPMGFTIAK